MSVFYLTSQGVISNHLLATDYQQLGNYLNCYLRVLVGGGDHEGHSELQMVSGKAEKRGKRVKRVNLSDGKNSHECAAKYMTVAGKQGTY